MPENGEQQVSHADRHDLDKLARWKSGLEGADGSGSPPFPVCAIFLVGPEDRAAHDIFRRYRSEFEELGGGFHHLVIFGQHGVSTTRTAFLQHLELDPRCVPTLVLAPMNAGSGVVYSIELPGGERDGDLDETQIWAYFLGQIRRTAGEGVPQSLRSGTAKERPLPTGSLGETVAGVLAALEGKA